MARRRRVSRGTSFVRRKLVWAREVTTFSTVTTGSFAAANLLLDFETAYGANLIGCTVMRMRIRWAPFTATPANAEVGFLGVRVADDATITASAAADPFGPSEDPHADWMAWDSCIPTGSLPQGGSTGPTISRYLDIKSMRKIDELGQGLYLMLDHTSANSMFFNWSVSTLIALP